MDFQRSRGPTLFPGAVCRRALVERYMQAMREEVETFEIQVGVGHLIEDPTLCICARLGGIDPVYMLSTEDALLVAMVFETIVVALDDKRPVPLIQALYTAINVMNEKPAKEAIN